MRRLLTICAIAGLAVAGVAPVWKAAPTHAANSQAAQAATANASRNSNATSRQAGATASSAKPVVIAAGVQARALAVEDQQALYLTAATAPNRVFTLQNFAAEQAALLAAASGSSRLTDGQAGINPFAAVAGALNPVAQLIPFSGSGQVGSLGDEGTALLAQFNFKTDSLAMRSGVAVAPDGTAFIADTLNSTIRRVNGPNSNDPGIITSVAGKWADVPSKDGALSTVTLNQPMGLALDRAGNLYIADFAAGTVDILPEATSATPGPLQLVAHVALPGAIAARPDGSLLYVASLGFGGWVEIPTPKLSFGKLEALSTTRPAYISGGPEAGVPNNCVNAAQPTPLIDCVAGMAIDGAGNLFTAWANKGLILRIDSNTGVGKTVATGLRAPGDMAFDNKGNLFVSEQGLAQVDEFVGLGVPVSNLSFTAPAALPPPTPPQVCTALVAQPSAFNFCNAPIGGSASTQTWVLTNNTANQVSGLAVAMNPALTPPNFTMVGTTCGLTLNAGASCNVQVQFTPQASGELDGALTATDEQGDTGTSEMGGTGMDYQLALASGQSTQMTVYQGSSVTFNLQVMPDSTFSDTVTFVCPTFAPGGTNVNGDVPPYTTCTFSPATATVSPGTPVPFTLTFQTTLNFIPPGQTIVVGGGHGPQGGAGDARGSRKMLFPALMLVLIALLMLTAALAANFWIARRERARLVEFSPSDQVARSARFARWRRALVTAAALAMIGGLVALSACHHPAPNPAIETTPEGTTTMNITATTQGASRGVTITLEVIPPPAGP